MNNEIKLTSPDLNSSIKIVKGELVSYIKNKEELIHQIGDPGWKHSDTEMFPIIGPTVSNDFKVSTPKGICILDQHGLLRELEYLLIKKEATIATFKKSYTANSEVKNSNFPHRSNKTTVSWPYDFSFIKSYELTNSHLKIYFEINAEIGMPFMFGYHPAFKVSGNCNEFCTNAEQKVTLPQILERGSKAYPFLNSCEINLIKDKGYNIQIKTEGFNNFMLWTEVPNMLCIEPITNYPYKETKELTPDFFDLATGKDLFLVVIKPF